MSRSESTTNSLVRSFFTELSKFDLSEVLPAALSADECDWPLHRTCAVENYSPPAGGPGYYGWTPNT